jgi:CBS domain-containing protein
MTIRELMSEDPDFLTPDADAVEVAQLMERNDVGFVPVVESRDTRRPIGVVTDRDLVLRLIACERAPRLAIAGELMSQSIVTCRPDDDVAEVERLMKEHQLRRLLVVDEHGSLVGVVTIADLALRIESRRAGETLREISQPPPER